MEECSGGFLNVVASDDNVHVIPRSLFEDWIAGRQKIQDTDDWELIVRRIVDEWLHYF